MVSRERFYQLYVVENKSHREIAKILGYKSTSTIHKLVKRFDISPHSKNFRPRPPLTEDHKQKLREFHTGLKLSPEAKEIALKNLIHKKGKDHPWWRGGKYKNKRGYILIKAENHPHASKTGYMLEHRVVIEKEIGRYLEKNEHVHHIDGNQSNNDPKNLVVLSPGDHMKITWADPEMRKKHSAIIKEIRKKKFWASNRGH